MESQPGVAFIDTADTKALEYYLDALGQKFPWHGPCSYGCFVAGTDINIVLRQTQQPINVNHQLVLFLHHFGALLCVGTKIARI